jgi:polysaccharide transporter, PST family
MLANLAARARQALRHVAVRNALFLYGVQISGYVFPFITLSYLSRVISPEKIGLISLATYFMWYFNTLTEYGFNLTATRRIAIQKDSPEAVNQIFNAVMLAKGLLTAVGLILMMLVVYLNPKYRANWPLFPLTFLTVIGGWLFPMWLYQGLEKMATVAARDFIAKLIATVLTLIVVRKESDYLYAAGLQSGATVIAGAISLALAPRICGVRFQLAPWRDIRDVLRQGWAVFLSIAAGTLTSNTNVFILGQITSSTAEVAYYTNANRLIVAMRMLVSPVVTALYPHISHMAAKSGRGAIDFLRKYSLLMALPFLLMSVVTFIFAPFIVHKLFGTKYDYTPSILLLRILAFQPFLLALSHSYATYYMLAFGFEKQWSRIILRSTVLNFLLLGTLIWIVHVRPITAMSIVGTVLDCFVLGSSYLFFRTTTAKSHPEVAAPVAPNLT